MTQKRTYFGKKTEEFQKELAKTRIRTRPGEKTEEEIKLFGTNWQPKKQSYQDRLKKEEEERLKKEKEEDKHLTVYERIQRDMINGKFNL